MDSRGNPLARCVVPERHTSLSELYGFSITASRREFLDQPELADCEDAFEVELVNNKVVRRFLTG
jgi:hypothetical protein